MKKTAACLLACSTAVQALPSCHSMLPRMETCAGGDSPTLHVPSPKKLMLTWSADSSPRTSCGAIEHFHQPFSLALLR